MAATPLEVGRELPRRMLGIVTLDPHQTSGDQLGNELILSSYPRMREDRTPLGFRMMPHASTGVSRFRGT